MTCRNLGGVIVCGPPPGVYKRRIMHCPCCERRHRFIVRWGGAWYGTSQYGSCGDRWSDGELAPRPFRRGWRKEAQAKFRVMWSNAASHGAYERYVRADCAIYGPQVINRRREQKAFRKRAIALELIRRERAA